MEKEGKKLLYSVDDIGGVNTSHILYYFSVFFKIKNELKRCRKASS